VTFNAQRTTQNNREASKIELVDIINHATHCDMFHLFFD